MREKKQQGPAPDAGTAAGGAAEDAGILGRGSLYILLAALLAGTLWRGSYFPTPDEFDFPVSLFSPRWALVVLLLSAGIWELVALAAERRRGLFASPLLWLFAAFTLYAGITRAWSEVPAVTLRELLLLLAFLAVPVVVRGQRLRFPGEAGGRIAWWLVYTAAFVAAWGIATYIVRQAPYANEVDGIFRAGGTLEYSNALGCFALMALPFAAALMVNAGRDDLRLLAGGITLLTGAVILSLSRSALVLLAFTAVYLLVIHRGGIRFTLILSSLVAGGLVAAVSLQTAERDQAVVGTILVFAVLALAYYAQGRLLAMDEGKAARIAWSGFAFLTAAAAVTAVASARVRNIVNERFIEGFTWSRLLPHREDTWSGAIDAFQERPFRGWGLGAFTQVYAQFSFTSYTKYAHNLVLQAAVDGGVIGAALLTLFLVYVVVLGVIRLLRRADPLARAAAMASLVFIAFNMFDWEWYVPALAAWFMATAGLMEGGGGEHAGPAGSTDQ